MPRKLEPTKFSALYISAQFMTLGKFLGSKAIFCLWPGLSGIAKKSHKTITSRLSGASLEKI